MSLPVTSIIISLAFVLFILLLLLIISKLHGFNSRIDRINSILKQFETKSEGNIVDQLIGNKSSSEENEKGGNIKEKSSE